FGDLSSSLDSLFGVPGLDDEPLPLPSKGLTCNTRKSACSSRSECTDLHLHANGALLASAGQVLNLHGVAIGVHHLGARQLVASTGLAHGLESLAALAVLERRGQLCTLEACTASAIHFDHLALGARLGSLGLHELAQCLGVRGQRRLAATLAAHEST